jgi:hypothetical protein
MSALYLIPLGFLFIYLTLKLVLLIPKGEPKKVSVEKTVGGFGVPEFLFFLVALIFLLPFLFGKENDQDIFNRG